MRDPAVFISCGQFKDNEKKLGKQICEVVESLTGQKVFFAEQVSDLNGLNENILNALRNCVGFVAVMHPRGDIRQPNGNTFTRASVWIEQEIAIAAYIENIEKRQIPIVLFKHVNVGLEGIRSLLHLNPIDFADDAEVLTQLPSRIANWKTLAVTGAVRLEIRSAPMRNLDEHRVKNLSVRFINDTDRRITEYTGEIALPAGFLKHWSARYVNEVRQKEVPNYRFFRFTQQQLGSIEPRENRVVWATDCCLTCALKEAAGLAVDVAEARMEAKLWVNGLCYPTVTSLSKLAMEAQK